MKKNNYYFLAHLHSSFSKKAKQNRLENESIQYLEEKNSFDIQNQFY